MASLVGKRLAQASICPHWPSFQQQEQMECRTLLESTLFHRATTSHKSRVGCGSSNPLARSHHQRRTHVVTASSSLTAAIAAPGTAMQRPALVESAPVKHKLPASAGPGNVDNRQGWSLLTPSKTANFRPQSRQDDLRRSIVNAAPRATAAELSTAAQMARLSSLAYYPDPSSRLEALGLELKECQQTPYTAFFVADGPADLFSPGSTKDKHKQEGKTRYIIARGVAFDREEVKWGDLWMKLLRFWPVEFEKGLTPRGSDLLVHGGVKEIAEQVYASLLPHLSFDPKKEGITAVRFGGHSLGGSLSQLLMLMFYLRSPLKRGWSSDLDFNSHTFGSFPVLSSMSPFHLPWEDQVSAAPGAVASCPLMRTLESLHNQILGAGVSLDGDAGNPACSVLRDLGLPSGASRAFVLDSDIIPRAFMALKHDAVKSLLQLREQSGLAGPPLGRPLHFQPVGLVHFMQSQGDEVSVSSLQPSLAEKALHMDLEDFMRNPGLLVKSIQDHYFNHYVSGLDSALASAQALVQAP